MNQFRTLEVSGWRQFHNIRIDFHPRLTIITGANGAGKSTLLSLLSRHFGYQRPFYATPSLLNKSGIIKYSMGLFRWLTRRGEVNDPAQRIIGRIEYSNRALSNLAVSVNNSISYDLQVPGMQEVRGLHIDSHRPPSLYRHVGQISATPPTTESLGSGFAGELQHHYSSGGASQGTLFHLKSALINMAIFGYGNPAVNPNPILVRHFEEFQDRLRQVLPESLGFIKLSIRSPEVVMETNTGDFILDAASGGVIKLVEIAWQLFSFSLSGESFVATIDEPENHLHPSMQRQLLGNLVAAFPHVQFVVVTHSPFVVSSVKDSNVIVLRYSDSEIVPDDEVSEMKV